jgi:XTP/dITP diphosphohydrolase
MKFSELDSILVATRNANKAKELCHKLELENLAHIRVRTLIEPDFAAIPEVVEDQPTFAANAIKKAKEIAAHPYTPPYTIVLGEDSGLCVKTLNHAPGVHSARYAFLNDAGVDHDNQANLEFLLKQMQKQNDRSAAFITVISLVLRDTDGNLSEPLIVEGKCEGQLTHEARGNQGFGYDPIFIPDGETRTFGEMSLEEKQKFSHRAKAFDELLKALKA